MIWRRERSEENTVAAILDRLAACGDLKNGSWFIGVTANLIQSLTAHGFDKKTIYGGSSELFCWDMAANTAIECKRAAVLRFPVFSTDGDSDFIDRTYPLLYVYTFRIPEDGSIELHIDTSGFSPVSSLPPKPVIITRLSRDDTVSTEIYENEFDSEIIWRIVLRITDDFRAEQMKYLKVTHRSGCFLWFAFGKNCCTIGYDANTSRKGSYQSYRNGCRVRRSVRFFEGEYPTYMVCLREEDFIRILRFFLENDRKPGKRQDVKWMWDSYDRFRPVGFYPPDL